MKNQYFGDVNDYRKYGLLRTLTRQGMLSSNIYWMLTEDDDRSDSGKLDYLLKADTWRGYDEELFDIIREAHGKDLYFFDPDNGMEVPSILIGRKNSSKYLYWQELKGLHEKGASVLIYQHFPRENRDAYIARMAMEFQNRIAVKEIISFRTPHVVFFLLALGKHQEIFNSAIQHLVDQWGISGSVW